MVRRTSPSQLPRSWVHYATVGCPIPGRDLFLTFAPVAWAIPGPATLECSQAKLPASAKILDCYALRYPDRWSVGLGSLCFQPWEKTDMRKRLGTMIATAAAVLVGFGMTVPAVPTAAVEIGTAVSATPPAIGSAALAEVISCSMNTWARGGIGSPLDCDPLALLGDCTQCLWAIITGGDVVPECLECAAEIARCLL